MINASMQQYSAVGSCLQSTVWPSRKEDVPKTDQHLSVMIDPWLGLSSPDEALWAGMNSVAVFHCCQARQSYWSYSMIQQQHLISSMAEEEIGRHRSSHSIQWLWDSPILHLTCPRRIAEHQRGTNLFKALPDLYQRPILECKYGWWPFMRSSTYCSVEIFCIVGVYILRTKM